jgi:hypothetical protein
VASGPIVLDAAAAPGDLDIRIVAGGEADPGTTAAIAAAVTRVLGQRDAQRTVRPSAWALAGRIEAREGRTVRSRALLPGTFGPA